MDKLIKKIKEWGKEKWIDKCSPNIQITKVMEEVVELHRAILLKNENNIKEEIGDVFISLVMLDLQQLDFDIEDSLNGAKTHMDLLQYSSDIKYIKYRVRSLYNSVAIYGHLPIKEVVDKVLTDLLIILQMTLLIDFEECVALSYNKISKREGQIIDGLFVKDIQSENTATCPHCGYENDLGTSYFTHEEHVQETCEKCLKEFIWYADVKTKINVYKIENDK